MSDDARGLFDRLREDAVTALEGCRRIGDHVVRVDGEDHSVYLTLVGGRGDIVATREARARLEEAAARVIGKHDPNVESRITAFNKGDDVVVELFFVAPSPG